MQPLTFITLSPDRESYRELADALTGDERTRLLADCDDAEHLLASLTRFRPAAAVIVLANGNSEKAIELVKKIAAAHPETAVITAGRDTPSSLMLNSLRSGARDFLQLPCNAEEFSTVVSRTAEFCAAQASRQRKSGSGRRGLLDEGRQRRSLSSPRTWPPRCRRRRSSSTSTYRPATPTRSSAWRRSSPSPTRCVTARASTTRCCRAYVTQCSSRLALLAAPLEAHEAEDVHAEDVTEVVHLVRERYDFVVFDLPHSFDAVTVAALDQAATSCWC